MCNKRGQLSVELSIFLIVLLILFIIIFTNSLSYIGSTNSQISNYVARDALDDISHAAQRVYLGGNNSKEIVTVQFPQRTVSSIVDTPVIGIIAEFKAGIQSQYLHDVNVPISGSLPGSYGVYDINVTSNGTTVILSYTE